MRRSGFARIGRATVFLIASLGLRAERVAWADACESARPTEPEGAGGISYGAADVTSFDSPEGRVRIWYALSGPHAPVQANLEEPPAVVAAATAADVALARFEELGFASPLSDRDSPCADNGGDGKVDVYLAEFAAADGQAVADHCLAGPARRCAGFVVVENDFARGSYADLTEAMNTVVSHELFHLVQKAYAAEVERWWAEGSAQWAAQQVHPELLDLERFLPVFFQQPWRPLDVPTSGVAANFLYATAIWPVFLSERHGVAFVRRVFERLAAGEARSFDAVATLLEQEGTTLAEEFLWFAAYNAATGERAQPGFGYRHAASYPPVALTALGAEPGTHVEGVGSGLGAFYYSLETSEPRAVSLDVDRTRLAGLLVPLMSGRAELDAALPLPARVDGNAVVVVAGQGLSKIDAPFRLSVQEVGTEPALNQPGKLASSCSFSLGARLGERRGSAALGVTSGAVALLLLTLARRLHRASLWL